MKAVSADFNAGLQGVTTLCQLFELERHDGTIYRRSTATRALSFEAPPKPLAVFKAGGFEPTDISSTFSSISDVEVVCYFTDELTEEDVRNGKLDEAKGRIFWGNWAFPDYGVMPMFVGIVSGTQITDDRTAVRFTISGRLAALTGRIGEVRSAQCRAVFGDERCTVDIDAIKLITKAVSGSGKTLIVALEPTDPRPFEDAAHAYWRVELALSEAFVFIDMIELRATIGGAQAAVGGTVVASQNDSTTGDKNNVFDGVSGTGWQFQSNSAWIGYHFAAPIIIKQFAIKNHLATNGPSGVSLSWSDDGILWTSSIGNRFTDLVWGLDETKLFSPADNVVDVPKAFSFGTVLFKSGENEDESYTIASFAILGDEITLKLMIRPIFDVAEDDIVWVYPGCDQSIARCRFYNNVVNYRGEPYTPTTLYQGQNRIP